jgi:hypothetical protein
VTFLSYVTGSVHTYCQEKITDSRTITTCGRKSGIETLDSNRPAHVSKPSNL